MNILVSGASGNLGRLIIKHLIKRGTPVSDIVAGARSPQKVRDLEEQGIRVVRFDYDDPASLKEGLKGIDRFVMVSVSQADTPINQHDLVIKAASEANLEVIAYTSVYRGKDSRLPLAPIHAAAEKAISESGVPYIFLRNNAYSDFYLGNVIQGIRTGVIASPAGNAKISGATRNDFAEAATVAITDDKYIGKKLELSGDTAFTFNDLAQIASKIAGRQVTYQPMTLSQNTEVIKRAGYPERVVEVMSKLEEVTASGELASNDHTLSSMIGHPTTNMDEFVKNSLGV